MKNIHSVEDFNKCIKRVIITEAEIAEAIRNLPGKVESLIRFLA